MIDKFGVMYSENIFPKGKKKTVMIMVDGEVIAMFDAVLFNNWLKEKTREIGEWIETGKVQKWHKPKSIKTDKDRLSYLG